MTPEYTWEYNPNTKIGYLKLSEAQVATTVTAVEDKIFFDKDKDGNIIGIEILL